MKFKYSLLGLAFDVFDWLILGSIPILGDIVDVFSVAYWYKILGVLGLTTLVELFPMADVIPTNLLLGIYADRKCVKHD